jgi:phosphomannomutase
MEEVHWRYRQVNLHVAVRMQTLVEKAKDTFRKLKVSEERTLDGYKLIFSDGSWVMFRPSGTEPLTRLYCESKDPQLLEFLVQQGTQVIESFK